MTKYMLLTTDELDLAVEKPNILFQSNDFDYQYAIAMALELKEYRKLCGPLGCIWLDNKK